MDNQFLYNLIVSLGLGIILSIGLFCAFKAENSYFLNNLHGLTFKKLKSDFKTGRETDGNFNLPEELNYFYIVERLLSIDEPIEDRILGLNQRYLDLINNGIESAYFLCPNYRYLCACWGFVGFLIFSRKSLGKTLW